MTMFLPLFPLELVVFPGEKLNLHIFEDRYKELISQSYNNNRTFGIPSFINDRLMEFGTEVEVTALEKIYPDGKMDISTRGLRTFRLVEYLPKLENQLYPGGVVSFEHPYTANSLKDKADEEVFKNLKEILIHLGRVLSINKNLIPSAPVNVSYKIAHYLGMPLDEEYELLLSQNETERQLKIIRYLQQALPDIEKRELMKKKIALNGHFKEVKPPHF